MTEYEFDPELLRSLQAEILSMQLELTSQPAKPGLKPLPIQCMMTSCQHGRHCVDHLRRPHSGSSPTSPGSCRDCGSEVFIPIAPDERVYGSLDQLLATCRNQQAELIRAHYWTVPIDRRAYNQALRMGRDELVRRVDQRVTTALTHNDAWSGRAAPYAGDIVAYAQHATATCCRNCAAYWHGLPRDCHQEPTSNQVRHAIWAATTWLDVRLPGLPRDPQKVAPIRRTLILTPREVNAIDESVINRLVNGADPAGLLVPEETHLSLGRARSRLVVSRDLDLGA